VELTTSLSISETKVYHSRLINPERRLAGASPSSEKEQQ
jgi:hypothetical protein